VLGQLRLTPRDEPIALRRLIAISKRKGFLSYEESDDNLPPHLTSSDEIDVWLTAVAAEGVEIVDLPARPSDD